MKASPRLFFAVVVVVNISACSGPSGAKQDPAPRVVDSRSHETSPAGGETVVAVNLPFADRIALVNLSSGKARYLPVFAEADMRNPSDSVLFGDSIAVVGTDSDRLALIDPQSGEVVRSESFGWRNAWHIETVGKDALLVAADAGSRGRISRITPELVLEGSTFVGPGPSGLLVSQQEAWAISDGISPRFPKTSVSHIDTTQMKGRISTLDGGPEGLDLTNDGENLIVSLFRKGAVVKIDPKGKVLERRGGLSHPWGVATSGRLVVVVEQAASDERSALLFLRASDLAVVDRLSLGGRCPDPRELVVGGTRAVIACAALPGVAIVDIAKREWIKRIRMIPPQGASFADFEQPRGLSVMHLPD